MPPRHTSLTPLDRFRSLRQALAGETIELGTEIDIALMALVARAHVFLLGPPGVGKTFLADRIRMRIDNMTVFQILMSKFTTDVHLIGPLSIPALKEERLVHVTKGFIPDAQVAIVDEAWKASGATANVLLDIANERRFRNDGAYRSIPMSTIFFLSNELPAMGRGTDENLAAIYDRIAFRRLVDELVDPASFRRLLDLELDDNPPAVMAWDDVLEAQQEARQVVIPEDVLDGLVVIRQTLRAQGICPSGRRFRQLLGVIRAAAWLDGDTKAGMQHLEPVADCVWDDPDQISLAGRTVMEVCSPGAKAALIISDSIVDLADQVDTILKKDDADPKRTSEAVDVYKKAMKAGRKLLPLEATAAGRAVHIVADAMRRLERLHAKVMTEAVGVSNPAPLRAELEAS